LSSMANALQWVLDHHGQYNITAVNISLSDSNNYAQNWFAQGGGPAQQITDLIGQLKAINIPLIAATGNSFDGKDQGEGFPAIVNDAISVTATDLSDHLLSNAQRLGPGIGTSGTTLAAPGVATAPSGDSGEAAVSGTSFAAPLVTGAVVLLQQIYESRFGTLPTVDQLESWLVQGSDPVSDPVTGITIGRLDVPKAAGLIPDAPSSPSLGIATTPVTTAASPAPTAPPTSAAPVSVPWATTAATAAPTTTNVPISVNSQSRASNGSTAANNPDAAAVPNFEELLKAMSIWAAAQGS
jgi:type VI secretion system secreted protein VgrG